MRFARISLSLILTFSALNIFCMESQKNANKDLLAAIEDQDYDAVELALAHGADPNLMEEDEPILEDFIRSMYTAETPNAKLLKIAIMLIKGGARITDTVLNDVLTSIVDRYLDLPDGPEFFESLLNRRINLNSYNQRGEMPLHTLLLRENADGFANYLQYNPATLPLAVRILLQHGANINGRTVDNQIIAKIGNTPLYLAANIVSDVVSLREHVGITNCNWWIEHRKKVARAALSIMEEFLKNGADPRVANRLGRTSLSKIELALRYQNIGLGTEIENMRIMILNQIKRLNERDRLVREVINTAPTLGQPLTLYTQLLPREVREMLLGYASGHAYPR